MAWANSSWITETDIATQETELRLHIQEVSDAITSKMMSDGTSVDPTTLTEYIKGLKTDLNKLKGGGSKLTRGRIIKL